MNNPENDHSQKNHSTGSHNNKLNSHSSADTDGEHLKKYQRILLINGVNLNLLGKREPEIYGFTTLADIENGLKAKAHSVGIEMICVQSNSEAELVEHIQHYGLLAEPAQQVDAIIINPAAFTHTSVALRDAIVATQKPFIEVHLSNVHAREPFRQHSYFSDKAIGVICGLGTLGYQMALDYFVAHG